MAIRRNEEVGRLKAHPNRGKIPRPRFAKIMALSCKDDLDQMVRAGYPLPRIAKWLQEEMGEYTDVGQASLVTTLSRYRTAMPAGELLASKSIRVAGRAAKQVEDGLDELDKLAEMFAKQEERINLGMKLERGRKKRGEKEAIPAMLNSKLTQDFAVALQILARRHDIKMDLGLQRGSQVPGINISKEDADKLKEKYGSEVGAALGNPESRAKVLSIVEMIKKRAVAEDEKKAKKESSDEGQFG